jgi:hypothetical protein
MDQHSPPRPEHFTAFRCAAEEVSRQNEWENEGGHLRAPSAPHKDNFQVELRRYGIVSVPLMVFDWGGYRYSNAPDAIAAARRTTQSE